MKGIKMSIERIKLSKPLLVNGEYLNELTYDIEELSINHIAKAEGLKAKIGGKDIVGTITIAQADYALHICIGMQAVMAVNPDISEEDLQRLKGFDITKLANVGARFFIAPAEQEQATSNEPLEATQNTTTAL